MGTCSGNQSQEAQAEADEEEETKSISDKCPGRHQQQIDHLKAHGTFSSVQQHARSSANAKARLTSLKPIEKSAFYELPAAAQKKDAVERNVNGRHYDSDSGFGTTSLMAMTK